MNLRRTRLSILVGVAFTLLAIGCGSTSTTGGDAGSNQLSTGDSGAGALAGTSGAGGGGAAGGAGTGGNSADLCEQSSDCPGGTCWQRLDGVKNCVAPTTTPMLGSCQYAQSPCCTKDGDCTDKAGGRCMPLIDVEENFCGGAVPQGNVCRYDECTSDADCKAQMPAGATVATCLPSGALGVWFATCVYGGCRTNTGCTKYPGGACQYGLAATNGVCSLVDVLFCAYPSDPCTGSAQGCPSGMECVPNADYQGRECGPGPPAYP